MRHILIVDDAEEIAYLFRKSFEAQNFRVTLAHSGMTALKAIADDPIDGIVTDFRMNGMDGIELITRIRERQPDIPAIVVTAYSSDLPAQAGNIKIFSKPVSPIHLVYQMIDLLIDVEQVQRMKRQD